jgi:hypothetical protein
MCDDKPIIPDFSLLLDPDTRKERVGGKRGRRVLACGKLIGIKAPREREVLLGDKGVA